MAKRRESLSKSEIKSKKANQKIKKSKTDKKSSAVFEGDASGEDNWKQKSLKIWNILTFSKLIHFMLISWIHIKINDKINLSSSIIIILIHNTPINYLPGTMRTNIPIISIIMITIKLDSLLILIRMEMIISFSIWYWSINWWDWWFTVTAIESLAAWASMVVLLVVWGLVVMVGYVSA